MFIHGMNRIASDQCTWISSDVVITKGRRSVVLIRTKNSNVDVMLMLMGCRLVAGLSLEVTKVLALMLSASLNLSSTFVPVAIFFSFLSFHLHIKHDSQLNSTTTHPTPVAG